MLLSLKKINIDYYNVKWKNIHTYNFNQNSNNFNQNKYFTKTFIRIFYALTQ